MQDKQDILRKLPSIREILDVFSGFNKEILKRVANEYLDSIKHLDSNTESSEIIELLMNNKIEDSKILILNNIKKIYESRTSNTLKRVINASGVILQTNLGRSIFHPNLIDEISPFLSHYTNLEYDLKKGARSERYQHIDNMLCALFNAESSLIVNNNAAAVFLILNTFARDKQSIISRGEIIEIGGSFRMHEIMKSAGTELIEVGTTNKTRISDYKDALNEQTALILKAHKSNFFIRGFTQDVEMSEITALCKDNNIIDYYDFGSGNALLKDEENLEAICQNPPSLLSFSGDKLLGGAQAGIILGKRELISRLKQNHLLRALRVDKTSILLLQATLKRYIDKNFDEIPTLFMLTLNLDILKNRAECLIKEIDKKFAPEIINIESLAGGGSLPDKSFESIGVALFFKSCAFLESELRKRNLISRIFNNRVVLDMRTIQDDELEEIIKILREI